MFKSMGTGALTAMTEEASREISAEKLQIFDQVLNVLDKNIIDYLKGGI